MARTVAGPASTMDLYMAEVKQYPLLDAEQEISLAQQYARGKAATRQLHGSSNLDASEQRALEAVVREGEQARQRLIRCNLRLVVSMAYKYSGLGLPLIDLVQEGNIGLLEAVERYEPEQRFRFATYAGWWIKQAIRRGLNNKGRLVRFPEHVNTALYRLRSASRELETQKGRRPTLRELAERLGMPIRKIHQLLSLQKYRILSLQMPVGEDGESELGDLIADTNTPPMEELYAQRHLRESVQDVVAEHLSTREQEILSMRFGLGGHGNQTLQQIADTLHISRERVRQIEARALRRLRYAKARQELNKIRAQI
jgi:RNA polymerase primary sigma factor